ncbi:GyrI-like domain-containing protein [Desemzia sp. FAM 24101]|uniref:GyrI-like domain-containing protein n=1 Tax=unclassified Desemzia TaxID=2685243 RepID=UPI003886B735
MAEIKSTEHYSATNTPEIVHTEAVHYLSVLGKGAPGSAEFYRKKTLVADLLKVLDAQIGFPIIEVQYWYPKGAESVNIADFYTANPLSLLEYRILTKTSQLLTKEKIEEIVSASSSSYKTSSDIDILEPFSIPAQTVIQVMHHGPFADEFSTLADLEQYAEQNGVRRSGPHLEIHLDSFTAKTPQDNLRTILRDPVRNI